MLLRQFHEFLREGETSAPAPLLGAVKTIRDKLEKCQRIVFLAGATAACRQIAEHPEQLRRAQRQIFAPFPELWMEFAAANTPNGIRVSEGFLWMGDGDGLRQGGLIFVGWPRASQLPVIIPARVNLDDDEPLQLSGEQHADRWIPALQTKFGARPDAVVTSAEMRAAAPEMLQWALAGWALIASHGITHSTHYDPATINRSRAQRGLYPLLGYAEIRLNIDVDRAVRAKDRVEAQYTDTLPLHPVRAHLRLLPSGKVVIVRAHMRGNPEYGVKSHHYTVLRAEDEIE